MPANPFFQYIDTIAQDTTALDAFNADPAGSAQAAGLNDAQLAALLSKDWPTIEGELVKEDAAVAADIAAIGWNQKHVITLIDPAQ